MREHGIKPKLKHLALSELRIDADYQLRVGVGCDDGPWDEKHARSYAQRLEDGENLNKVKVVGPDHIVVDGFHRTGGHTYRQMTEDESDHIGHKVVEVLHFECSAEDAPDVALLEALKANSDNGIHRDDRTQRHVVLIASEKWPDADAVAVGRLCGCTSRAVNRIWKKAGVVSPEKRRKAHAEALVSARPEMSASEVAAEAGVSERTVKRIRKDAREGVTTRTPVAVVTLEGNSDTKGGDNSDTCRSCHPHPADVYDQVMGVQSPGKSSPQAGSTPLEADYFANRLAEWVEGSDALMTMLDDVEGVPSWLVAMMGKTGPGSIRALLEALKGGQGKAAATTFAKTHAHALNIYLGDSKEGLSPSDENQKNNIYILGPGSEGCQENPENEPQTAQQREKARKRTQVEEALRYADERLKPLGVTIYKKGDGRGALLTRARGYGITRLSEPGVDLEALKLAIDSLMSPYYREDDERAFMLHPFYVWEKKRFANAVANGPRYKGKPAPGLKTKTNGYSDPSHKPFPI